MDNLNDFHTVKDLKFDVTKLQSALEQVLKIKKYDNANGFNRFPVPLRAKGIRILNKQQVL